MNGPNEDALKYINEESLKKRICNHLYGLRNRDGQVEGLIDHRGWDMFWLPKYKLCSIHENLIDKWIALGGIIE